MSISNLRHKHHQCQCDVGGVHALCATTIAQEVSYEKTRRHKNCKILPRRSFLSDGLFSSIQHELLQHDCGDLLVARMTKIARSWTLSSTQAIGIATNFCKHFCKKLPKRQILQTLATTTKFCGIDRGLIVVQAATAQSARARSPKTFG